MLQNTCNVNITKNINYIFDFDLILINLNKSDNFYI